MGDRVFPPFTEAITAVDVTGLVVGGYMVRAGVSELGAFVLMHGWDAEFVRAYVENGVLVIANGDRRPPIQQTVVEMCAPACGRAGKDPTVNILVPNRFTLYEA